MDFRIDITNIENTYLLTEKEYNDSEKEIKQIIENYFNDLKIILRIGETITVCDHVFEIISICYCDWKIMIELELTS